MTIPHTISLQTPKFIRFLLFLLFPLATLPSRADVITFNFLALLDGAPVTGQGADGSAWNGPAVEGSYRFFNWTQQDLTLTVAAEYWPEDADGNVTTGVPAYVYLQQEYAGLGACDVPDCGSTALDYLDRLILAFSEQVELIGIAFNTGADDSEISPDDDDYRAYNTRIDMSGGPDGPMVTEMGGGKYWQGSLTGNRLDLYMPEGGSPYIESITVRTQEVPEPASLSLIMLALALGWLYQRRARQ
ncbi:MAG: PEP-CTERM sorting domain-containing protein [Gammaproteobacteria bacterium]|nr:PEP-CTERM sorting domain-containing protein [Gammaproteobacteria bacterium]